MTYTWDFTPVLANWALLGEGLLNTLSREEILDLAVYLERGGEH